jgi:hypothetical protein
MLVLPDDGMRHSGVAPPNDEVDTLPYVLRRAMGQRDHDCGVEQDTEYYGVRGEGLGMRQSVKMRGCVDVDAANVDTEPLGSLSRACREQPAFDVHLAMVARKRTAVQRARLAACRIETMTEKSWPPVPRWQIRIVARWKGAQDATALTGCPEGPGKTAILGGVSGRPEVISGPG